MSKVIVSIMLIGSVLTAQDFDVYISDAGNFTTGPWKILKTGSSGGVASPFITSNLNWPQDILFLEDQEIVLISNLGSNSITAYNAASGAYLSVFASGISGPTRMEIGADSLIYVLQWSGNGLVWRYDQQGNFVDEFTSVAVTQSIGLDWDADGNLYVSSYNGDHVRKFDPEGNDLGLFVDANLAGPTNIWFDAEGNLLVVDYNGNSVKKYDSNGTYVGVFISGIQNAEGVDFMPNGDILIGSGGSSSVNRYDSEGNFLSTFVQGGFPGMQTPNAVVIRYSAPVSADDVREDRASAAVTPSVGVEFQVSAQARHDIQAIEIYDLLGRRVETIQLGSQTAIWQAHQHPQGLYFILMRHQSGSISTQKVLVRY